MVRRGYTAAVERGEPLLGAFAARPYAVPEGATVTMQAQISPDGPRSVDERRAG